jgi:hypothetical protein
MPPEPQDMESRTKVPARANTESITSCGLSHNYRTDEGATEFKPLASDQKIKLAFDHSFDPTAFLVAGVFAGSSMAEINIALSAKARKALANTTVVHLPIR